MQRKIKYGLKNWSKTLSLLVIATVAVFAFSGAPQVAADRFDEEIRRLQQQNASRQGALDDLRGQAGTYQDAIAVLRAQIAQLQAEIDQNVAKQNEIQKKIEELQAELDRQKKVLAADIKAMYVDGDISTIEMLATSKNLSEFVDKETYRNAVQKQIQDTLKKIQKLQADLNVQKQEVEKLLLQQRGQQQELDSSRAEQARLLSLNQKEQAAYSGQIKAANAEIARLRAAQAEENCRIFGCSGGVLGGGGYPWGHAKCYHTDQVDSACYNYDWYWGARSYDNIWNYSNGGWGYRNCTDWVAFRSGGRVPSAGTIRLYAGSGNAKWWDDAAREMGKTVGTTPHQGDTAVSNSGDYGHVLYVENVDTNSVTLSDYNRAGTGKYDIGTFQKVGEGKYRSPTGREYSLTFVSW